MSALALACIVVALGGFALGVAGWHLKASALRRLSRWVDTPPATPIEDWKRD